MQCAICIEDIDNTREQIFTTLVCNHTYHQECFDKYLIYYCQKTCCNPDGAPRLFCPTCRTPLQVQEPETRYTSTTFRNVRFQYNDIETLDVQRNNNNTMLKFIFHRLSQLCKR